jgi:hypothetical protein
MAKAE